MELKNFKGKLIESFVGNMLMLILNLILPMVLTRLYGVEIFGSYIYGITIVSMSLLLANLGMDMGLLYFIPKTGKKYVTSCFVINVLTSAVTMLLSFILYRLGGLNEINIVLNFLLIPIWGIDGAAFASMVSTVFVNILGFFVVKKIIHSKVYFII